VGILNWLTGGVVNAVKDVVDEFVTTEEERLDYELKKAQLELVLSTKNLNNVF